MLIFVITVLLLPKLRITLIYGETNCASLGCGSMEKKEKFEPQDSENDPRKDEQAVTKKADRTHNQKEAKTTAPALKRKFSEQPPTKHNSKT